MRSLSKWPMIEPRDESIKLLFCSITKSIYRRVVDLAVDNLQKKAAMTKSGTLRLYSCHTS